MIRPHNSGVKWNWSSALASWFTISKCYIPCVRASVTEHAYVCVSEHTCVCACVGLSVTMCSSPCVCVCGPPCGFIGMYISDRVAFQPGCNSLAQLSVNRICMPKGSRAFWKSNSKILDWLTHRDRAQENYQFRFRRSNFFSLGGCTCWCCLSHLYWYREIKCSQPNSDWKSSGYRSLFSERYFFFSFYVFTLIENWNRKLGFHSVSIWHNIISTEAQKLCVLGSTSFWHFRNTQIWFQVNQWTNYPSHTEFQINW